MNRIILMGNLTGDPEILVTSTGKTLCRFSIAVNRNFEEGADYFNCLAWGELGSNISKFFKKGKRILVEGRVKVEDYTNSEGIRKRRWNVVVSGFEFASSKEDVNTESSTQNIKTPDTKPIEEPVVGPVQTPSTLSTLSEQPESQDEGDLSNLPF